MNLPGRPVAAFDPEGLIFAAGISSESLKLYDLRSFDKVRIYCVCSEIQKLISVVQCHILYIFGYECRLLEMNVSCIVLVTISPVCCCFTMLYLSFATLHSAMSLCGLGNIAE